jgi:hypothetical protein
MDLLSARFLPRKYCTCGSRQILVWQQSMTETLLLVSHTVSALAYLAANPPFNADHSVFSPYSPSWVEIER